MNSRGNDPMRPSTPPPASSWWTAPAVQQDRASFDAEAAKQAERMNAVTVSYNKPREELRGNK